MKTSKRERNTLNGRAPIGPEIERAILSYVRTYVLWHGRQRAVETFGANYVVHADASFTLDRRIASGDVLTRREPRGRQRRVYVALDDDPPENSAYAEPSLAATPLGLLPPS